MCIAEHGIDQDMICEMAKCGCRFGDNRGNICVQEEGVKKLMEDCAHEFFEEPKIKSLFQYLFPRGRNRLTSSWYSAYFAYLRLEMLSVTSKLARGGTNSTVSQIDTELHVEW